jgi:hypothetical protein
MFATVSSSLTWGFARIRRVIFSLREFSRFCRGFLKKRAAKRGFLVVNLWWNRGDLW